MSAPAPGGEWPAPAAHPPLADDEVHVWRAPLDAAPERVAALGALLAEDERGRAARFAFPDLRARYAVARGRLRVLLGRYLAAAPASLRFAYGPQGKPALADGATGLEFNLAHSGHLALYAVTRRRAVGVDVEAERPRLADELMARRFFSPAEVAALLALPPTARVAAFFRIWTRKEAYLKAKGGGLSLGLDTFDVALEADARTLLLATRPDPAEAARWALVALAPGPGYAGAVAAAGAGWRVRCFDWLESPSSPEGERAG